MKSSRVRAGFDWEPEPDERPVRFAADTSVAPGSDDSHPPFASRVGLARGERATIASRRRTRRSPLRFFQPDVRTPLSRGAKCLLAGGGVCAFCIGWSWGARVGSTHAALQTPAAPQSPAIADVATAFEREVVK